MTKELLEHLKSMRHSPAHNYVIPGLTSWLIGNPHPEMGCVRMFSMSRLHEENIVPHSHRFDFRCVVLKGRVVNHIWQPAPTFEEDGTDEADWYVKKEITYSGTLGTHDTRQAGVGTYIRRISYYNEGDEYSMKAEEFHSIRFDKGTEVLFFEGVNRLKTSFILEPMVNGEAIPLFKTEPWMFDKREFN